MSRYLNSLTLTVIGLLVAGGFGVAYATARISFGTLVSLWVLTLALIVVAVIFTRRMTHPDVSIEQMLYKTDHSPRT